MKITCDTCAMKYAIADDKIRGRRVKIRCKRCGESIVVRGDRLPAPAELATAVEAPVMTGERNDSSVLFSVNSLAKLAGAGQPSDDGGSGMVDIRKLAGALERRVESEPPPVDDLLAVAPPVGLGPLGAPVIPPSEPTSTRLPAILGASVAGLALAATAVAIAVVVIPRSDARAADVSNHGDIDRGETVVEHVPTPEPEVESTPEPVAVAELTEPEVTAEPEVEETPAARARRPRRPRVARSEAPTPRAETPTDPGERSLQEMMRETLGDETRRRPAERARDDRPMTPTRAQVSEAMDGVAGAVRSCGQGASGMVPVAVVFSGESGRVRSAQVQGTNVPPAVRSCVARAVRGASVVSFQRDRFSVTYPFRL